MNKPVSFRDNVGNKHGDVYRSSAIFYVPPVAKTRTIVSFLNYWPLKRSINVLIVISTRSMDGTLITRERVQFTNGQVFNYEPAKSGISEGSVEIEVFATENLVIPYAAIVAWYETDRGISVVHSYSRAFSMHEVEEGRSHSIGREGCWTIADSASTKSFCVFHNGPFSQTAQTIRLAVTNAKGARKEVSWKNDPLAPFQTVRLEPRNYFQNLEEFLWGEVGYAEIDFNLGGSFTRMLVGNERVDGHDLQVTHSNFNYTAQKTDTVGPGAQGWMVVPEITGISVTEVVVYPQSAPGAYRLTDGASINKTWRTGEPVNFAPALPSTLSFSVDDVEFPTRLVTSIRSQKSAERLANECSLGVITALQPPKRLWWGAVQCDRNARSSLVVHDLPEIYKGIRPEDTLSLRLYSASSHTPIEINFEASILTRLENGMSVADIWPNAADFLQGKPGYYTLYCPYGGLTAYAATENDHGSVCLEHGF